MNEGEYRRMFEAEQASWWFRARRRILCRVLERLDLPAETVLADLGCGTGGNLEMLGAFGDLVGVELSETAAAFARTRASCPVVLGSATDSGLETASRDLVTMFDVLEHLEDDLDGVQEVRRVLKKDGLFLFTVPAFMSLWSAHDVALHHFRRYRKNELRALLEKADFNVEWLSYYNTTLFPPVAAIRLGRRLFGGGDDAADGVGLPPRPVNALLESVFAVERHVLGRMSLPFGVSLIGLARAT